jgi:hypothetical protein
MNCRNNSLAASRRRKNMQQSTGSKIPKWDSGIRVRCGIDMSDFFSNENGSAIFIFYARPHRRSLAVRMKMALPFSYFMPDQMAVMGGSYEELVAQKKGGAWNSRISCQLLKRKSLPDEDSDASWIGSKKRRSGDDT